MASSGTVRNTMSEPSMIFCASPRERLATPVTVYPARENASESPLPTRPAPTKPSRSEAISWILPVERAQQRRPLEHAVAAAGLLRAGLHARICGRFVVQRDLHPGERLGGEIDHFRLRRMDGSLAREDLHLDAAGLLEPVDQVEGLRNARRTHQKTMVAQDHRAAIAQVLDEASLLA